ncbi:GGDEF domain-containing protein [Bacillus sp. V5-8f]|nr:GGDEF domain-containing protein [Bacillus sp. V5-8f]
MADLLFNQVKEGVILLSGEGDILECNAAAAEITGYLPDELKAQGFSLLLEENHSSDYLREMKERPDGAFEKLQMIRKNGTVFPCSIKYRLFSYGNGSSYFLLTFSENARKNRWNQESKLSEKIFENIEEGVMITDADKRILSVNPAFQIVTGYSLEEVIGKTPKILQSGLHNKRFYDEMWSEINQKGRWNGEVWNKRKDGEVFPEWLTISLIKDENEEITNFVAVFSDISERKNAEDQLRKLAHYDSLTGAANRYLLNEQLDRLLVTAERYKQLLAVLFLDLDRFKMVNDTLGHNYGDLLLKKVSARLKGLLKNKDMIARLGGDEFVIVLPNIKHPKEAAHISGEIIRSLEQPFILEDKEVYTSTSIGIGVFPFDGKDTDTLIKNADRAMYVAKSNGRNKFEFYHSGQHQENESRKLSVENRLRKAIENKELSLYYQPQALANTGEITGVEALLRWNDKELGNISPGEFIPIAEETGLIVPISEWVIDQACQDIKFLHVSGHPVLKVAINISGIHFGQDDFVKNVSRIIEKTNIKTHLVELELTESTIMPNAPESISKLVKLKQLGIKLSIDDFGTGYSSLSYLHRFPIDSLKIDQSFVKNLSIYKEDASIVTAIITMAHTLNLEVVAEGVENNKQLKFLKKNGCETIQGFFLTKPLPFEELKTLLQSWEPWI